MEIARKELLYSRICSGFIRCIVEDQIFILNNPSVQTQYIANELYYQVYNDCLYEGLYHQEDMLSLLIENGVWDNKKEERLNGIKKDIEEIKCKLYEVTLSDKDNLLVRNRLSKAKQEVVDLEFNKHCYDHITVEGVAILARQRFIIGCSIVKDNGQPFIDNTKLWESSTNIVEKVMEFAAHNRITEGEYREIARTDPWLKTWSTCKSPAEIFGNKVIELSDEQKTLLAWSLLYDNILEHPEHPHEDVLHDDDRLDGWMILQKRKREQEDFKSQVARKTSNQKIANADEVYVMAEKKEDIQKIDNLNEGISKIMKSKRMGALKKHGQLHEIEMPDTKVRLLNAIREKYGK